VAQHAPDAAIEPAARRVLVADDHAPFRAAVGADLVWSGFDVCAEAGDAAAAVEAAVRERPDLCLLDVGMPGGGIAAARAIAARLPATKVVMLSASRSDEDVVAAFEAGAAGYLLKDIEAGALAAALERIVAGEIEMPRRVAERLFSELSRPPRVTRFRRRRTSDELTPAERTVLAALAAGRTTASIAADLGIARTLVRAHLDAILEKLRARRAAGAR
jgi:DNA-binding NarL/FixJ family response regulator